MVDTLLVIVAGFLAVMSCVGMSPFAQWLTLIAGYVAVAKPALMFVRDVFGVLV